MVSRKRICCALRSRECRDLDADCALALGAVAWAREAYARPYEQQRRSLDALSLDPVHGLCAVARRLRVRLVPRGERDLGLADPAQRLVLAELARELTSAECTQLCRGYARECRIVEICTGVGASECVNRVPFTPEDASVDASVDGGPAPTRGFGVECVASHQCIGGRRPEGFEIEPRETTRSARRVGSPSGDHRAARRVRRALAERGRPAALGAPAAPSDAVHARLARPRAVGSMLSVAREPVVGHHRDLLGPLLRQKVPGPFDHARLERACEVPL